MLILSSDGLSSENLLERARGYLPAQAKSAALVTTASVGYKDKDWNIPRLTEECRTLGLFAECFDVEFQDPARLLDYEMIVLNGGNPFYLLKWLQEKNCREILKRLAEEKLLVGVSAGSVVLQDRIDLIASYSPEMNDNVGLIDLRGMCLTDYEILPHYHRFLDRFERFEERAQAYEREQGVRLFRIDDGQALFIGDGEAFVL